MRWDVQPHLAPLYALLGEYERVAAILIDKERARLFIVYLGAIEEQRELRDWVPGKQATGGWFALAQTHYARRHEEYVLHHVMLASSCASRIMAVLIASSASMCPETALYEPS